MADNMQVTPGSGATVAADEIGGALYQRVKLTWGVDGAAVDASATNPLPVTGPLTDTQLRATAVPVLLATAPVLVAGEAHIGEVGGKIARASTEFTRPADTTAYTAGDVVSNSTSATTLIDLANAVRVNGGSGYIVRVALSTDKKSITPRFRVHFFNASGPTVAADNAAYKELYADGAKRLGYVDMPAMITGTDTTNSDMSRTVNDTVRLPVVAGGATRSLYAVLEALDAFTPASGEKITLTVFVDNN